ncbi:acyl-CoA dehydrogenase family protein [Aureimonas sp. ME7]|uniref:acyl-CoA dehydrogenase family protein n=1 Tax=Aureimonas sp. ME7 TaxID=2744252 RepID=UPI0015F40CC8|nr:acyl-CoA dehydrogenase family protein [Aureimonas sp. ME7]
MLPTPPADRSFIAPLLTDLGEAIAADREGPARLGLDVLARHGLHRRFAEPAPGGGYRYAGTWDVVLELLAGVGGVDLSTARLLEGHLNTLQLVALYGTQVQQGRVLGWLDEGGWLGVWGADGEVPLRLRPDAQGGGRLEGAKRYASGAGTLRGALVPVGDDAGVLQLLLLSVDDPARVDLSTWNQRGMRRTASGTYRFDGIEIGAEDIVGAPNDYKREPFFVGGIWRCAAAQLGALEAIVALMVTELSANGRDASPLQMMRIATAIMRARTARFWVEDAAQRVELCPPDADEADILRITACSALARVTLENAAMEVIDLAERALGLGSFALGHPAEALTRDLAVYIRQANPDGTLIQHGRALAKDWIRR